MAPQADPARLPLLMAQLGLWYAQELRPDDVYNVGEYLEIFGPLDGALLDAAYQRVLTEVETLRIRIVVGHDGPQQVVEPYRERPLRQLDLGGEAEPLAAAQEWIAADMGRPVDLSAEAISCATLIRVAQDHHIFHHRSHHLAMDGWSWALVARRLADCYTTLAAGRPWTAGEGSLRDLLDNEAAYRSSAAFGADADHWRDVLADRSDIVSLSERPVAPHSRKFLRHVRSVPTDTARRVAAGAQKMGTRWSDFLVGAVAAYVGRIAGSYEVTVGLPVSARFGGDERRIPGVLANVVPLRVRTDPSVTVAQYTAAVRTSIFRALRHGRYRSEDMRRATGMAGADAALFGPVVNVTAFDRALSFAGSPAVARNVSHVPVDDLHISIFERAPGDGWQVVVDGNADRYSGADLEHHTNRILDFAVRLAESDLHRPIGTVELVSVAERGRLLVEFGDGGVVGGGGSVVGLFGRRVVG
ncbi:condensation domain-containing protein, partial [Micromonospora sp. NPDC048843]|uniref:condensation domain-containing protein n=1 Tax=Micromonospora sp. NPDC048843 TaxID=3155389 RepID=UPI0033E9F6C7